MSPWRDRVWWRIAWRNLGRNRRRTALTASALSFGFVAAVIMIALMDGMIEQMVSNGTEVLTGQIQIHTRDFRPERSIHSTLGGRDGVDVDGLLASIEQTSQVTGAAPRLFGGGLVSSGDETVGAVLMGVDPQRELGVSRFGSSLVQGRLPRARELAIGSKMAETIDVGVGDEVVLVAPAADGSMGNDLYTVSGVFHMDLAGFDELYAILYLPSMQDLMALDPRRIHEVAIAVERRMEADAVAERIQEAVTPFATDLVTEPWSLFQRQLYFFTNIADRVNAIVAVIVFGMAIFGVANTMLLATYERRREFAVARALGTSGGAVGRTVVYEGVLLGAIALAAGGLLTVPILTYLHANPIDLSRFAGTYTLLGSAVRPLLTVEYSWEGPLVSAVALVATGILSALYPAWRAVRIPPADALANR